MGTLSILIVDDDKMILELLTLGFERYGLKVLTAENGSDALDLFKREHIDLVLTDIIMPGFNGHFFQGAIRICRAAFSGIKCPLVTGQSIRHDALPLLGTISICNDLVFISHNI